MSINKYLVWAVVRYKVLMARAQGWSSTISFAMVYYLFAQKILSSESLLWIGVYLPGDLWYYRYFCVVAPIIFLLIIAPWDLKHVLPAEQVYYSNSNPEWRKVRDAVCVKEEK